MLAQVFHFPRDEKSPGLSDNLFLFLEDINTSLMKKKTHLAP
jgi:hypothetical protein